MILRKSDFTDEALKMGIWEAMTEKAPSVGGYLESDEIEIRPTVRSTNKERKD